MSSKIITQSLRFILILILISGLFGIVYSQNAKLTVPSDVRTETMILNPQDSAPASPTEGQIYYNNTDKRLYYHNGTEWKLFADPDKAVATKVVSAYNSTGATRPNGTACVVGSTDCNNPKADYVCDGTADQNTIQAAIDALGANPGVVYLLEGTYNISGAINFDNTAPNDSGKAIIGTGKGSILKVSGIPINNPVISAYGVNKILISQLMIDGNSQAGTNNAGIFYHSVTYSKIEKVWVENMSGDGVFSAIASHNNIITNSNMWNNKGAGIHFEFFNNNIFSHNNVQSNKIHGMYFSGGSKNIVSHNNVQANTFIGINAQNGGNNFIFSNNNVQGNSWSGLSLGASYKSAISNNNVQGNAQHGILLSSCSDSTISNNNVQGNTYDGISLSSSSTNAIVANVIYYDTAGGSGAYDGIKLGSNSATNIISSNRLYDSKRTGFGINIAASGCDNNYLSGNLIDGTTDTNPTGYYNPLATPPYDHRIQDLGAGTRYTDKAKLTFEQAPSQNPGANGTINATATYIPLNPTPASYSIANITDGKSGGDLLILENINATNSITIPNGANTRLSIEGLPGPIQLYKNDILSLIWDGNGTAGVGDWVEIGYSDNSP